MLGKYFYHELTKKITDLENEISDIENKTHQINYLMKASTYFLEYTKENLSNKNNERINDRVGENDRVNKRVNENISEQNTEEQPIKFFVTRDVTNRGKICQEYIKECIGEGYSLSTPSLYLIKLILFLKRSKSGELL